MLSRKISLLSILCLYALLLAAKGIPLAPEYPHSTAIHGMELSDPWHWLKEREHPQLKRVLKAESEYTRATLKASQPLAKQLLKEYKTRIPLIEESAPIEDNGYAYFSRQTKKQSYPTHWRRKLAPNATDELLLDENKLARGKAFFALGTFAISPDNRYLAYSVDYSGDEYYRLYIKDLSTGKTRDARQDDISDFIWLPDSSQALITRVNSRWQTDTCHLMDVSSGSSRQILAITDPKFDLSLYSATDKRYIIICANSKTTTSAWYLDTQNTPSGAISLFPGKEGVSLSPDIVDGKVYIQTDLWNRDGSIAVCNLDKPGINAWRELIPGISGQPISTYILNAGYITLIRRVNGNERLAIHDIVSGNKLHEIIPPEAANIAFRGGSEWKDTWFDFTGETYLNPTAIYRHDLISHSTESIYQYPLPPGYDPEQYSSREISAEAADGSRIPILILHRKDLDTTKPQALWLYGYGAYGDYEDPWFWGNLQSLLDRGIIYCIARVRGGGEMGRAWHDAGRLMNKMNSFTDFVSCLRYLQDQGWTTPQQTVIEGGSAGGLLVGAVVNLAPDAMRLVIADVPFVDVVNTMLDDTLPLTQQEYEEWGDPADPDAFAAMLAYCPYENVRPGKLPNILISSGWHDSRVGYWEGLKWAQKLRRNNTGSNAIVFRLLDNEGHTGSGDRMRNLKTHAETSAYALKLLGIE